MDKNIQKLERLLSLMDEDSLTKENFIQSFEKVLEFVLKIQKEQEEAIKRLEETHKMLLDKNQYDHQITLSDLKRQVNDLFVGDQIKRIDSESKMSHAEMKKVMNEIIDGKIKELKEALELLKKMKTIYVGGGTANKLVAIDLS